MMCLNVDFFEFILFDILSVSWIHEFMSFTKFKKFSDIII